MTLKALSDIHAEELIAPCGLDCRLCRAYQRREKACRGCRGDDRFKSRACATCAIKNCEKFSRGGLDFCIACAEFPCARMNRLARRYSSQYGVPVFDNLMEIKVGGVRAFVESQNRKWLCPKCAKMLCMHKGQCMSCGYDWRKDG